MADLPVRHKSRCDLWTDSSAKFRRKKFKLCGESPSIGVDLVEWKKAARFYHRHSDRLSLLLTPSELSRLNRSTDPAKALALFLAAKEAVFKALGFPWMGAAGFRNIAIGFAKGRLSFRLSGNFSRSPRHSRTNPSRQRRADWSLVSTETPRYVLVECRPCAGI